jgi:NAD(P)-dependent dehydrogenase (short-subunit alcohol dehydrogenase family)
VAIAAELAHPIVSSVNAVAPSIIDTPADRDAALPKADQRRRGQNEAAEDRRGSDRVAGVAQPTRLARPVRSFPVYGRA